MDQPSTSNRIHLSTQLRTCWTKHVGGSGAKIVEDNWKHCVRPPTVVSMKRTNAREQPHNRVRCWIWIPHWKPNNVICKSPMLFQTSSGQRFDASSVSVRKSILPLTNGMASCHSNPIRSSGGIHFWSRLNLTCILWTIVINRYFESISLTFPWCFVFRLFWATCILKLVCFVHSVLFCHSIFQHGFIDGFLGGFLTTFLSNCCSKFGASWPLKSHIHHLFSS